MSTGENIRKLRKQKELTLKQLGNIVHLSEQAIGQYERGERIPNITILQQIANALNVDVNQLTESNYFIEKVFNLIPNEEIDPECKNLAKEINCDNSEHLIKLRLGQFMYDDDELKETESSFIQLLKYCCLRFSDELYPIYKGLKEDIYTLPTTFNKYNIISLLDEYYSRNLKDKEQQINTQYELFFTLCKKYCGFDISFNDNQFNVSNTKLGLNYSINEDNFTEMFKNITSYISKELFYQSYDKFIK